MIIIIIIPPSPHYSFAAERGRKCVLPETFLRPPGWSKRQLTLGDEQLAMMLQNELFRKEVFATMGSEFGLPGRGMGISPLFSLLSSSLSPFLSPLFFTCFSTYIRWLHSITIFIGRQSSGHAVQATYPNEAMATSSGSIMKSLSEMGSGMKQKLLQMAASFSGGSGSQSSSNRVRWMEKGERREERAERRKKRLSYASFLMIISLTHLCYHYRHVMGREKNPLRIERRAPPC